MESLLASGINAYGHFQTLAAQHQMSVTEVSTDVNLPKKCNEPISDLTLVHNLLHFKHVNYLPNNNGFRHAR